MPKRETVDRPSDFPVPIYLHSMIVTMFATFNCESMQKNLVIELLEIVSHFSETFPWWFLRLRERGAIDNCIAEKRLLFAFDTGFFEVFVE